MKEIDASKMVGGDHWNKFIQQWMQKSHWTKQSPLVNKTALKILINVGLEKLHLILLFFRCHGCLERFQIRIKVMEIKSTEIDAALN